MGGLVLIVAATAYGGCETLEADLAAAEQALLLVDSELATRHLQDAEAALGCGWILEPAWMARFWLIEGALMALDEDAAALDSLQAAHRIDPDSWISGLGDALRSQYETASALPQDTGSIETLDVDAGYRVRVDGALIEAPATVDAGLHLVQIGIQEVSFAQLIYVLPGATTTLQPVLPLLPPTIPMRQAGRGVTTISPKIDRSFAPYLGIGLTGSVGQLLIRGGPGELSVVEPPIKVTIPLDLGVVVRLGRAWFRASGGVAPLPGGELMYPGQGEIQAVPWLSQVEGALGGTVGRVLDLGVHGGAMMPGRATAYAVTSVGVPRTALRFEARIGGHVIFDDGVEPAFSLFTTFAPSL